MGEVVHMWQQSKHQVGDEKQEDRDYGQIKATMPMIASRVTAVAVPVDYDFRKPGSD